MGEKLRGTSVLAGSRRAPVNSQSRTFPPWHKAAAAHPARHRRWPPGRHSPLRGTKAAWRSGRFQGREARPLIVTEGAGALTAWGGGAAEGLGVR